MSEQPTRLVDELGIRTYTRIWRGVPHNGSDYIREDSGVRQVTLPFVSILADKYRPEERA